MNNIIYLMYPQRTDYNANHGNVENKLIRHQSNFVKGGIAVHLTPHLYSPGGNSNLQLHVLARGLTPKSPLSLGTGTLAQCVIRPHKCTCRFDKWHLNPSSGAQM